MVLYKGYCRPLGKKVDFTVKDVISMNTKRGIKWRVKGTYDNYNISTFCSKLVAEDLLNKLPLTMDAEIAYTPAAPTYESEELLPLFSNATKNADEIEAEEETIEVQEQIQENTNAQELDLHSEKLPAKYYKKNGSLDMRYSICREYAAKRAESQNAVELEAPWDANPNSSVDVLRATMKKRKQKLAELYQELEQRNMDLKDKHDSDIATYGKALGDKQLRDKIEMTERKILKKIDSIGNLQAKIDAKFKLSYRDNKVLKDIRSNDPTTNTASESNYRFDHRYRGSARQRRIARRKAEESFDAEEKCDICSEGPIYEKDVNIEDYDDPIQVCQSCFDDIFTDKAAESFGAETPCAVMVWKDGALTECGWWNEKNEPCVYHPDGKEINAESFGAEEWWEEYRDELEAVDKSSLDDFELMIWNDDIVKKHGKAKMMQMIINTLEYSTKLSPQLARIAFKQEKDRSEWEEGMTFEEMYNPNFENYSAESFEAAYTPEQKLDDYTPEQLTTSSAVTGDFFEDSLKYSYGGIQAAEEMPQEETEIVYAEGFPALQNAEAGMVVENIENYYKDKEDKFMTLVVDEATLFRLASDLPIFVELTPSRYAGYTNLRFNYVENPDLEQKILSYAISLPSNMEQQEEPEYLAGDVRNRLFNVEFDDWTEQEMKTHGKDVSFKEWADEESKSHGDEEFMDWAKHEEESHDERYEAEGGRNVSDFEMGNTDRYEIGDEIIALSSALKRAGDWDWKNVKKIGKGIKQGKYERIQKHMADIDYKTRRVLWDKHHNDFYNVFNDEQMRGLAIPWVTDKYKAESFEAEIPKDYKIYNPTGSGARGFKIVSANFINNDDVVIEAELVEGEEAFGVSNEFFKGVLSKVYDEYDAESFDAERREPIFGDEEDGVVMYADGSLLVKVVGFPTPFSNEPRLIGESMWVVVKKGNEYEGKGYLANKPIHSSLKFGTLIDYGYGTNIRKPMFKGSDKTDIITLKQMLDPNFTGILRTTPDEYYENEMQLFGDEDEEILKEFNEMGLLYSIDDKLWDKKMKGFDAESFEAKQEVKPRKLCVKCSKQRLTPHASNKGITVCATCQRRFGLNSKKAESFEAQDEPRKKCINCNKQKLTPSATSKGYTICGTCTRRYNLGGRKYAEENGEDEYKFVSRIPKSMGIGEKTEILRNNLEYVIRKANRPLYPREVVELYNRERGSGKQSRFKKGGLSTGKISRLIKSEPQKYYVSRSGLIHHVGESSMKDYIKNLPEKYYAEQGDLQTQPFTKENILRYLENSHEFIRKYDAPWKYSSNGMAEKFGKSPARMRKVLGEMEKQGLLKTVKKSTEVSRKMGFRKVKIYYLADKRLTN